MEVNCESDEIMEIDPPFSDITNDSNRPIVTDFIDMTIDDDTPDVIPVQDDSNSLKNANSDTHTKLFDCNILASDTTNGVNHRSVESTPKATQLLSVGNESVHCSTEAKLSNVENSKNSEEDCIEIDDDISICSMVTKENVSLEKQSLKADETIPKQNSQETDMCLPQQEKSKPEKMDAESKDKTALVTVTDSDCSSPESRKKLKKVQNSNACIENVPAYSSDQIMRKNDKKPCDTVILTDDESIVGECEVKAASESTKNNTPKSQEPCSVKDAVKPSSFNSVPPVNVFSSPSKKVLSNEKKTVHLKAPSNVPVEIIDIEAVREKRIGSCECVNPNCKSGDDLREAESFVIAYYNVKPKKGLKMCSECYNIAMDYADVMLLNLTNHQSIFDIPFNPDSLVVSLDLDSDEENTNKEKQKDSRSKPKKLSRAAQNYLDDSMQSLLNKYDFDFQLKEGNQKVESEISRIKADFDSMKLEIDDHFKNLKDMYNKIHLPYAPQYISLSELQIDDIQVQPHGHKIPLSTPRTTRIISRLDALSQGKSRPKQIITSPPKQSVATKKVTPYKFNSSSENLNSSLAINTSDIVQLAPSKIVPPPNLPNQGILSRPPIQLNQIVYFMKSTLYGVWIPGKVVKIAVADKKNAPFKLVYKIRPEPINRYQDAYKSVPGKFVAYFRPASVRLAVGTRVIAIFKEENAKSRNDNYYAGVIAEPPKSINKFRYLVFFDDGYAQYISHDDIRVVCESSQNVWDDVLPDFKDFIMRYLLVYPERPMVKLQKKQMVKTEWNGKWWIARVMEIDSSLVKMLFDADGRVEWIYRGSTRLGPLFAAHKRQETGDRLVRGLSSNLRNRNMPYVEYTRQQEYDGTKTPTEDSNDGDAVKRAVARKSGTGKAIVQRPLGSEKKENVQPVSYPLGKVPSKLEAVDLSKSIKPKRFVPHQCGPRCIDWVGYSISRARGCGPLAVPLLNGFERVFSKVRSSKAVISYIAPCGRRLRNISEIHRYLRITLSQMTVDQFSFEEWVNCLSEFKITKYFNYIEDLSYGKEKQPISCVNYLDNVMPQYVQYITEREPREGVHLNLDPDFLVCCDCTDDCQDREKCACWKLTMDNQKIIPGMDKSEINQGYIYRRLPERIVTGIFECNSRCHCSKTSCLNRVVQHPLMQKLQLFKTEKKGWGIRCLNDIPIGSFICIYAGHLLTENSANEEGKNYGDEYLAELDYIEVIERIKEDYEESVPSELMSENEKEGNSNDEDDNDDEEQPSSPSRESDSEFELKSDINPGCEFKMRLRKKPNKSKKKKEKDKSEKSKPSSEQDKSSNKDDENDSDGDNRKRERAPLKFNPTVEEDPDEDKDREKSLRNLFGEDESVYVMDAKCNGNIGRYLNHSCEPNVFVQNVFVDTHDLRFPWVAFFALNYIPAGQELTWDYNYDVNSVPGKVMYCYCNSNDCRGRLL